MINKLYPNDESGIAAIEFGLTIFAYILIFFFMYNIFYITMLDVQLRLACNSVARDTKTFLSLQIPKDTNNNAAANDISKTEFMQRVNALWNNGVPATGLNKKDMSFLLAGYKNFSDLVNNIENTSTTDFNSNKYLLFTCNYKETYFFNIFGKGNSDDKSYEVLSIQEKRLVYS